MLIAEKFIHSLVEKYGKHTVYTDFMYITGYNSLFQCTKIQNMRTISSTN